MSASPGSLLVVDDSEMNRDVLARRLERNSYEVATAESANQALQLLAQKSFDLVLLDVEMPETSGLEVLRLIRQTHAATQLPVIMVTARNESEDIVEGLRLGANDYVTKPVDMPVVLARIETHLNAKRSEQKLRDSEERYALAASGANEGLWDWNLKTGEIYLSPRCKAMLGLEENDISLNPEAWQERVHPADVERVREAMTAHLRGQASCYESEHRMLHADGSYRWVLARGMAIRDAAGTPTRMAGSQADITKGKVSDPLTGLPNRLLFTDQLERAIQRSKRRQEYLFAVLLFDLNQFKVINDSFGHDIGDQLLIQLSRRLIGCLRSTDVISRFDERSMLARLGGDEFLVLLDDISRSEDAIRIAERIVENIEQPFEVDGHEIFTSASVGIAISNTGYERPEGLVRDADAAMYRAKAVGRGRCEVYDPEMRRRSLARMQIESELRRAIERQEFTVHYQPIVCLVTGKPFGFEALVRWNHPERGIVPPAEFISIAEDTGLIVPMGSWVLFQACKQMKQWHDRFNPDVPWVISVNLSAKQFRHSGLVHEIEGILDETGLNPASLKLEITESMVMLDHQFATTMLLSLKALGIQLAIDDFGTGHSSLSYLHSFPLDMLKVDRSFVMRMNERQHFEIVRTIVSLGHNLGLDVVAEGVEQIQQAELLASLGCDLGQGYYFARPLAQQQADDFLSNGDPPWAYPLSSKAPEGDSLLASISPRQPVGN